MLLVDKSRSNSELLSEMLVNSGSQGADEFENDLIKDLLKEVSGHSMVAGLRIVAFKEGCLSREIITV